MDNDAKHTVSAKKRIFEEKEIEYYLTAKLFTKCQLDSAAFQLLKRDLKAERPTNNKQLKSKCFKGGAFAFGVFLTSGTH